MPEPTLPSPNELLQILLDEHGYETQINGERITIAGQETQISGHYEFQANASILKFDVRFHLPDGRTLIESCAGVGKSLSQTLGDAFNTFCNSSFHVLLNAFLGGSTEIFSEEWQLPLGNFTVWVGNATFRGQPPSDQECIEIFWHLARLIQKTPLNPTQSHWIRLYYAQHQSKLVISEVLLDNEDWEMVRQQLAHYSWPKSEDFYSMRLFLALTPVQS